MKSSVTVIHRLLVIFALSVSWSVARATEKINRIEAHSAWTDDDETHLRNTALVSCISGAFKDEAIRKDTSHAYTSYVEFGSSPLHAYTRMSLLADAWLKAMMANDQYEWPTGDTPSLLQCTALADSEELRTSIKRHTAQRTKTINRIRGAAFAHCVGLGFADNADVQLDVARAKEEFHYLFGAPSERNAKEADWYAAYQDLFEPAKYWLALPYKGKHGKKFTLMKCTDFYNSRALRVAAQNYLWEMPEKGKKIPLHEPSESRMNYEARQAAKPQR